MRNDWKYKIAKITGCNYALNHKIMKLKRSWDEVECILNSSMKKKKR
jgi:hypothetical protein